MAWGIYDTKDDSWLGDEHGPKTFEDEVLAKVAAQIASTQLGTDPTRCRAREYDGSANKLKGEFATRMTPEQALRHIEKGGF